ncbi:hypothetical protein GCM10025787_16240 [Saccharopolyspora rosea]|uniref:TadE family type IV pilus minor pilin n=1 Tax=Saccharopolyspora rosea TaxID=524884 RepID=A0ABW3FT16_9PSEU
MSAGAVPTPRSGAGTPRDDGSVTVEAAFAICALVAVFGLVVAGIGVLCGQLRCADAAAEAARLIARGDRPRADAAVARIAPAGAALAVRIVGDEADVAVSAPFPGGLLPGRWVEARALAVLEPEVAR